MVKNIIISSQKLVCPRYNAPSYNVGAVIMRLIMAPEKVGVLG